MVELVDPEGAHIPALRPQADFIGKQAVELGCGDGRLALGIACDAAGVFAFDSDAGEVERARRTPPDELAGRVNYEVASAKAIELRRHASDLAVISSAL